MKRWNPTKAHGFGNISVRMIQLCGDSIILLAQIFKYSLGQCVFPNTWKMANTIPVYKKEAKYLLKNYRSISLFPFFAKLFKRLLLNSLFPIFIRGGFRGGGKARGLHPLFFTITVFFLQSIWRTTNCYSKLNWSLIMHH